jgi:SAM-dependent methyltransferase
LLEFTGERVVPGQTGADLWNEHLSRYCFAARLGRGRRVLDIACGAGYGTAELARTAQWAVGLDNSPEAVGAAWRDYDGPNVRFLAADAAALPFRAGSFDLVVAFEAIEHLEDWKPLLEEARRVLAPGGQFAVSTPNRLYYEETRREAGANPFHVHEFEFAEFEDALRSVFPSVSLFLQNHAAAIVFHGARAEAASPVEVQLQRRRLEPEHSHFFLGVCALAPQTGSPVYVYLPAASNVLREREHHILKLEGEVARKNEWLEALKTEHAGLVEMYRRQSEELRAAQAWAGSLQTALDEAGGRVIGLQKELEDCQSAAREAVAAYEAAIGRLEADLAAERAAAREHVEALQRDLDARRAELARCVELLDAAEAAVVERTRWAQSLQARVEELNGLIGAARASRWLRLGRAIGMGPDLAGKP